MSSELIHQKVLIPGFKNVPDGGFYDDFVQGFGRMDQNLSCMTHTIPYSIWLFTYRQLQLYIWTYSCISVSSSVSTCQFASFKVGG